MDLIPANEMERLAAVRRYEILDTPEDGSFDRVTQLAARIFSVPVAIVSLVDHDRIWFKSHYGLNLHQIDRAPGLCASAILADEVYTVLDAKTDPRTLANPLVAGEFGLQFYAAAPLTTHDGFRLGTLCILNFQPASLSDAECATLKDLASIVMDEIELRLASRKRIQIEHNLRLIAEQSLAQTEQLANLDKLTGLGNRRALDMDLEGKWLMQGAPGVRDVIVAMIDLNGLKMVNDCYGHKQGDWVLISFARNLRAVLRQEDKAYRYGGDEFVLLLPVRADPDYGSLRRRVTLVVERVQQDVGIPEVGASIGFSTLSEKSGVLSEALHLADERMYKEKNTHNQGIVREPQAERKEMPRQEFVERRT